MKYYIKHFRVRPTQAEIKEVVKYHEAFQDYCKVWLEDGTTKLFDNDTPIVHYFSSWPDKSYYYIDFVNAQLNKEGSFGKFGIIRAKRIIEKKQKIHKRA